MTVKIKPLVWELSAGTEGVYYHAFDPIYGRDVEAPNEGTCDAIDRSREARILAALEQPTDDDLDRAALARPKVRALMKCLQREATLIWIIENTFQVRIRDLALDMLDQQREALSALPKEADHE